MLQKLAGSFERFFLSFSENVCAKYHEKGCREKTQLSWSMSSAVFVLIVSQYHNTPHSHTPTNFREIMRVIQICLHLPSSKKMYEQVRRETKKRSFAEARLWQRLAADIQVVLFLLRSCARVGGVKSQTLPMAVGTVQNVENKSSKAFTPQWTKYTPCLTLDLRA